MKLVLLILLSTAFADLAFARRLQIPQPAFSTSEDAAVTRFNACQPGAAKGCRRVTYNFDYISSGPSMVYFPENHFMEKANEADVSPVTKAIYYQVELVKFRLVLVTINLERC